ncbi:hypothetical protein LJR296_002442 [Cupriavidus necator]|uniref:hypothetical protein n=1 Tax=Cupriavidus necator TaxID=106590 RepID=UPI003ECED376
MPKQFTNAVNTSGTTDYESVWGDCVRRLLDGDVPRHIAEAVQRSLMPWQLEESHIRRQDQARHLALAALAQAGDDMADLMKELANRLRE